MTCPSIEVGILFSPIIRFCLTGTFRRPGSNQIYSGDYTVRKENGICILEDSDAITQEILSFPACFIPQHSSDHFILTDVVIGIHFHWERTEAQKFKGTLKIIDETEHLTAVNLLSLEDYLESVISSEMKATSPIELLKAHAVISRSWLLAQKEKSRQKPSPSFFQTKESYIRWYDREDHAHFDVCADDHCQRYQGISRASLPSVREAMQTTSGEVLLYEGKICDARFSKCCGGVTERFENTWEPVSHPYLDKITDAVPPLPAMDLTNESEARKWILSVPPAFCNTQDSHVLSTVLNDYDLETRHFFRWEVSYTEAELSAWIQEKLQLDLGTLQDIQPIERGESGRIIRLRLIGSKRTVVIGKELVIRKALSPTHLYSSAFVVDKTPEGFLLRGAGWGHGVGLCQIGAAVMAVQGYSYQQILRHYFKGCEIKKIY